LGLTAICVAIVAAAIALVIFLVRRSSARALPRSEHAPGTKPDSAPRLDPAGHAAAASVPVAEPAPIEKTAHEQDVAALRTGLASTRG
jgi:hypothetical protein